MVGRSSCNLQKITEGPQENGSRRAERKADMILTVTLNPAVDKTYRTGELFPGRVNRMRSVDNIPGGKGINVSKILRQYDYEVTATGFLGGYQGKWMEAQLDRLKIRSAFVHVEEETRSSMNIVADNGYVTEILEPGPHISEAHLKEFGASFIRLAEESSLIILSGSAAPGISADIYARLIRSATAMGKKVILDTSGELLKEGIQAAPAVVKPNRKELEYIIGRRLQDREDVKDAANVLLASGIRMVMISLGDKGLILAREGRCLYARVPRVMAMNTVGCGDSVVASLAMSMTAGIGEEELLQRAAAVSAANATTLESGNVPLKLAEEMMKDIEIMEI